MVATSLVQKVGAFSSYNTTSNLFTNGISDYVLVNVTSYNWTLMPSVYNNSFNSNGTNCYITWNTAGNYVLEVNTTNTCGTSTTSSYPINVSN